MSLKARGWISSVRAPIWRKRNATQSEAASRSTEVPRLEVVVCDHGGEIRPLSLGGHWGGYRLFELSFCEYAIRGSKRPHPALFFFSFFRLKRTLPLLFPCGAASLGGPLGRWNSVVNHLSFGGCWGRDLVAGVPLPGQLLDICFYRSEAVRRQFHYPLC